VSPSGKASQPPGWEREREERGCRAWKNDEAHHRTANASCLPLPRPLHIARVALGPSSLVANQRRNVVMAVHDSIVTGSPTGKCIRRFLSDFPSRKPFFFWYAWSARRRPRDLLATCCGGAFSIADSQLLLRWGLGFAFAAPAASWEHTRDKRPPGRAPSCMHASDREIHRWSYLLCCGCFPTYVLYQLVVAAGCRNAQAAPACSCPIAFAPCPCSRISRDAVDYWRFNRHRPDGSRPANGVGVNGYFRWV
jgi:hypothetical protein